MFIWQTCLDRWYYWVTSLYICLLFKHINSGTRSCQRRLPQGIDLSGSKRALSGRPTGRCCSATSFSAATPYLYAKGLRGRRVWMLNNCVYRTPEGSTLMAGDQRPFLPSCRTLYVQTLLREFPETGFCVTTETKERRDNFLSALHVNEGNFSLSFFRESLNECNVLTLRFPQPMQEEEQTESSVVVASGEMEREEVRERRQSRWEKKTKE